ncbi:DUF6998 domain-containing protein [Pantoea ananatis]|uniref:DUF6998 domain-containing protein n=1 Tax=Pantoea ananas TaxID=553 RepID=UPI001C89C014|nr:hypothetical protein [Pantoea ananatis]QZE30255.1 hypothetical protein K4732_05675 [Pantoea ananatis]
MHSEKHEELKSLLKEATIIALRYYQLTRKPLGVTGEVAEYEAATILGLDLCTARQAGYDATESVDGIIKTIQIKGRYMPDPKKVSARLGSIDIAKPFDNVLLFLLDENYDAFAIYEATRENVLSALQEPGSRSRNERNQLGITKFKAISTLRWSLTSQ